MFCGRPRALQKFLRQMARVIDSEGQEEEEEEDEEEKKDEDDQKLLQEILPHEPLNLDEREFNVEAIAKVRNRNLFLLIIVTINAFVTYNVLV